MRVVEALNNIAGDVIKWPQGDKATYVKETFQQIAGLPNVLGAIDGSYIDIKAPIVCKSFYKKKKLHDKFYLIYNFVLKFVALCFQSNAQYYINRKNNFAITLQAICDAEMRFTDCFTGYASSVHDIRIFRNSDLWKEVGKNYQYFFPAEEYIIGDKAYPVLTWCIPSYRNYGNLTAVI